MVALFACLGAASIYGQNPRSFPGSAQDTRGSRFIQAAQTPLWLGGEQEFQLFQAVTEATLRDSIGPRASYFLTRLAAGCRAASPLYTRLKRLFLEEVYGTRNYAIKFSVLRSVSHPCGTVGQGVPRAMPHCATFFRGCGTPCQG